MSTTASAKTNGTKVQRRFRGLSPEERREQRRERLVRAGLEAFGKRGFHAVGVRDICAEAELTERYFYESFENREALFLAVYDHAQARLRAAVGAALEGPETDASLVARAALRAVLETLRDEPSLARVLLIDVLTVGADVGRQSILVTQGFVDMVTSAVLERAGDVSKPNAFTSRSRAAAPGKSRRSSRTASRPSPGKVDPRSIANGLVGSTLYIVMQWALNGFKDPLAQVLDHCVVFYDAILEHVLIPTRSLR